MSNKKKDYNFTAYPNYVLDELLKELDSSTFKVLTLIVRNTLGHHKKYDAISLSQFQKETGLSRNTVLKAINYLIKHGVIEKVDRNVINRYRVILPNESTDKFEESPKSQPTNSSNSDLQSSTNEPPTVQKLNLSPVQSLNTLKKPIKETKINSNTTKEDDLEEVIQTWNSKFEIPINDKQPDLMKHISSAINKFGTEQLFQAMEGRLASPYYRETKPELLHQPSAFFPFHDTIKNDVHRLPKQLFTYDEYVRLITEKGFNGDHFLVVDVQTDHGTQKRWKLKKKPN